MSDANMAKSTKQVIISLVIVGVMVATANQIGRNFLLANITARLDSFENNIIARLDSLEKNSEARVEKGEEPSPDLKLR